MKNSGTSLIKMLMLAVLCVVFAVSIYFNYYYYKKIITENKNISVNNVNIEKSNISGVAGKVVSIDSNSIKINDSKKDIIIKLTDKTIYEKTYLDPSEIVKVNVSRENINIDLVVGIIFTPESRENNLIAKSINISGNNILTGQIISIKNNEIVINEINTKKEYKIVINDKTEYYQENNKENITFPLNLDMVNGDQIKVDENISVFLVKNIDEDSNFIAKKIIIVKK